MKLTFFPVGNGDTTLLTLNDGGNCEDRQDTVVLIDFYHEPDGQQPIDVAKAVRERLPIDKKGRPYVDAFCLSHPDEDHCKGLVDHFHLGPISDYVDNPSKGEQKIIIREMWSSPLVFRRREAQGGALCEDAVAWRKEAKRRLELFRKLKAKKAPVPTTGSGDRLRLIGKDSKQDGTDKNADVAEIVTDVDQTFVDIDGRPISKALMEVLGPLPKGDVEGDEVKFGKNRSSIIIRYRLQPDPDGNETLFLTAGDAEVEVWVRQWEKFKKKTDRLEYDILLVPHHCSWHVLANQDCSWSGGCRDINNDARSALSQNRKSSYLIASSKPISSKDSDPPCTGTRDEYKNIAKEKGGEFYCTGEYPKGAESVKPLVIEISADGPELVEESDGGGKNGGGGLARKQDPRATTLGGSTVFG